MPVLFETTISISTLSGDWRGRLELFLARTGYLDDFTKGEHSYIATHKKLKSLSPKLGKLFRQIFVKEDGDNLIVSLFVKSQNLSFEEKEYLEWEMSEFANILKSPDEEFLIKYPRFNNKKRAILSAFFGLGSILFIIFIIVAIFAFFAPNSASAQQRKKIINTPPSESKTEINYISADIYLIPYEGFDIELVKHIAKVLSQNLRLNVLVSDAMPVPHHAFNIVRNQYESDLILAQIKQKSFDLKNKKYNTLYIGLLEGSIYPERENLNFVFARSSSDKTVIIANAEMKFGDSTILYHARLYKMLKRNIGKAYYRFAPSQYPNGVMAEPIASVMDLDNISALYDNEIRNNARNQRTSQ